MVQVKKPLSAAKRKKSNAAAGKVYRQKPDKKIKIKVRTAWNDLLKKRKAQNNFSEELCFIISNTIKTDGDKCLYYFNLKI